MDSHVPGADELRHRGGGSRSCWSRPPWRGCRSRWASRSSDGGLFDIDLIIRRTLVYAPLAAALTGVYLTGVVGLSTALRAVAGGTGTVVVTVSTLAVAATFHPLRTRIQQAVDRRFSREGYAAAATVDRFADRLRDQIDLGALNAERLTVVRTTMRPEHAGIWIRPPESP